MEDDRRFRVRLSEVQDEERSYPLAVQPKKHIQQAQISSGTHSPQFCG